MRLSRPKVSLQTGGPLVEDDTDALNLAVYALRKVRDARGVADRAAPAIAEAIACLAIIDAAALPWRCDNCHRSSEGTRKRCKQCGMVRP